MPKKDKFTSFRVPAKIHKLIQEAGKGKGVAAGEIVRQCVEFAMFPAIIDAYIEETETLSPADIERVEEMEGRYMLFLIKANESAKELTSKVKALSEAKEKIKQYMKTTMYEAKEKASAQSDR